MNSPPPKPEVILTDFFAEPTVLLVPITSRDNTSIQIKVKEQLVLIKDVDVNEYERISNSIFRHKLK